MRRFRRSTAGASITLVLALGSSVGAAWAQQPIRSGSAANATGGAAVPAARPVVRQVPAPSAVAGTPAGQASGAPPTVPPPPASAAAPPAAASALARPAPVPTMPVLQSRAAPAPLASGNDTRRLLDLQAGGQASAPGQPMLGVTSHLAWQRYLETYKLAVPQWFETHIERDR